jgi:hypothetical protein
MLAMSVVDQDKPKTKIGCFCAKHAAFRRKSKDWLALNQDNVSEWIEMTTCDITGVSGS